MNKTSLFEEHTKLNAKMVPFAGWEMPIQYTSVKDEVLAVRKKVGVFDVSHMGEFFVTGPDTYKFINYLVTNDIESPEMKKAVYSPMCRNNGTVIDDLIVYKLEEERAMICVNAANIDKDWNAIKEHKDKFNVKLENKSDSYSLLAVQGPNTVEALSGIGFSSEILDLPYYSCLETEDMILARTGYTGEDGFEIFANHSKTKDIWSKLIEAGVAPCGLAARDTLRIEVCYPLYGNEIHDEVTPLDAALKWTVKFKKGDFVGKKVLMDYRPKFRLVKLVLDKGIPRTGYEVVNSNQEVIGTVTSGTMSVTLEKGIALAHVDVSNFPEDDIFFVRIRNKDYNCTRQTKAFLTGSHK
jgi:aminomethyltransferase